MLEMKPNCYECKHRQNLIMDAHSTCTHPTVKQCQAQKGTGDASITLRKLSYDEAAKVLNIQGHPHGIKNGWFTWPANFDPVWLENCDGFERRKKQ